MQSERVRRATRTLPAGSIQRPNILLVVADDLGWSDIGAFGGEIATPRLDALARRGVRLTNFHASPVCSTTRAMLMTGCDHHEVGLGNMVELMTPAQKGKPGYEGYLNERAATIAERLRDGGYLTLMSGKWHLGIGGESPPSAKGFARSFALFQGEHNHFGDDQTPETAGFIGPSQYALDGKDVGYPLGAYSSDYFADRMIDFLDEARADGRPLFGYLAFTAPHCPLQAPAALIAKYRGRYDNGPEDLRERRLRRMKELGLSAALAAPARLRGPAPWAELEPAQRALEARKMEIYAAMVEAMDSAIGRIVDALDRGGRLSDTLIVFLSDNGPAGTLRESSPGWREWIEKHADNRFDNIGQTGSYTSVGPRWAQAQAAPFFLFKRYTTEGGVRTCAFASGAGVPGRVECDAFIHAMDLAPTFLELAGMERTAPSGKIPMRGKSAAGVLQGREERVHPADEPVGWELAYGRAIRKGDWKAVYLPPAARNIAADIPINQWLLFNLACDPAESNDLAAQEPQKLRELVAAWDAYARATGVVLNPE